MSYRDVRRDFEQHADGKVPCRQCNAPVSSGTLSDHGGMCYPCYLAYSRSAERMPAWLAGVPGRNEQGPRDWARRLKARHEAGDRLSKAQIDAYTEALRGRE